MLGSSFFGDALATWARLREFNWPSAPRLITPPAVPIIARDLAKLHCRIEQTLDDALIDLWIEAAAAELQKLRDEAFITQTWELTLAAFPVGGLPIDLFPKPVQSITSINYIDSAGDTQTFGTFSGSPPEAEEFTLIQDPERPRIALNLNQTWPLAAAVQNAVTIQFVCGYGDASADVPALVRAGALLLVGHFNENREAVVVGASTALEIPLGIRALFEVPRVG